MTQRLISVGDDFALPVGTKVLDSHLPDRLGATALSATIGTQVATATKGKADTLRRIAARAPVAPKVMATPPTVTISAGNAATSIAGGILKAPKRATITGADGAPADTTNDPNFSYLGTVPGGATYGTVSPDNSLIAWTVVPITGVPSSQVARWEPRIGFQHTGQVFEFLFKGLANPNYYRIRVNGEYATADMQPVTIGNTGQVFRIIVDFGSVATRDVVVEVDQLRFGGVTIEPTATISRLIEGPLKTVIIGDSISAGSAEVRRRSSATEIAAAHLGAGLVWNLGVGGTGFINGSGDGLPFSARITTDLPKTNPDLVILFGGYNDRSSLPADVQAAALTAMQNIVAAVPNAAVFVVGCWTSTTPGSTEVATNNAVKAAAAAAGLPFIDLLDPANLTGAPAFTTASSYRAGDVVTYNGVVYEAIAYGPAGAWNAANWRAASLIYGTGKVGTLAGNGNADVAILSDGVHPTILGAKIAGSYIARAIHQAARAINA